MPFLISIFIFLLSSSIGLLHPSAIFYCPSVSLSVIFSSSTLLFLDHSRILYAVLFKASYFHLLHTFAPTFIVIYSLFTLILCLFFLFVTVINLKLDLLSFIIYILFQIVRLLSLGAFFFLLLVSINFNLYLVPFYISEILWSFCLWIWLFLFLYIQPIHLPFCQRTIVRFLLLCVSLPLFNICQSEVVCLPFLCPFIFSY